VRVTSIFGAAARVWIPLVITVVVIATGFAVSRLHRMSDASTISSTSRRSVDEIVPFNPKRVVYEVFGPDGAVADINYLDAGAQPQRAKGVSLPWTYTITTTLPAVIASVVAQGDSNTLGCRILVNGAVKDDDSVAAVHAQTFCLVKSA
jgi:Mycobacterium membrane protein